MSSWGAPALAVSLRQRWKNLVESAGQQLNRPPGTGSSRKSSGPVEIGGSPFPSQSAAPNLIWSLPQLAHLILASRLTCSIARCDDWPSAALCQDARTTVAVAGVIGLYPRSCIVRKMQSSDSRLTAIIACVAETGPARIASSHLFRTVRISVVSKALFGVGLGDIPHRTCFAPLAKKRQAGIRERRHEASAGTPNLKLGDERCSA
jgi:hypothetical protein